MTLSRRWLACWLAVLALVALAPAVARAQIPADERWRVFGTAHFRVHFTPGLDELARRAADRAEAAHAELSDAFVRPPAGRIALVVTDNVDYANGFATPFPRNRVVVFAQPPIAEPSLSFYDDWLDLVITHELTHVFHLDYAAGIPRALRSVFGRIPASFPNTTVPDWTVEGLATYLESRLTRAGRVRGTMHEMALRTAILEDRFFSLDRASGDPTTWPGGSTRYVYGSMFLDWMARRHGQDAAGEFVRIYGARVVPFLVDRAAKSAYDESFSRAWGEWRGELLARYGALADSLASQGLTEPVVMTEAGRETRFPRWSPDSRSVAYTAATGRDDPSTRVVDLDGRVRVLAARTTAAPLSWRPGGASLLTSMIEIARPSRYYSELYEVGADGGQRRLTRGARLTDVDVAPRGRRIAAIRSARGSNEVVVIDTVDWKPRVVVEPDADVQWANPRWSPDERWLAVSRWRRGGRYDVVVISAMAGSVVYAATDDRAVDMAPTWSRDGRYVLFSSDRTGIANLYAYDVQGQRLLQVTNVLTGAFEPDVSPDGRWIAFTWYRADGYHVARIPYDPSTWRPAPPVRAEVAGDTAVERFARVEAGETRPYSAARSLPPTWWSPTALRRDVLGTAIGATTAGQDIVERHDYAAYGQVYVESGRWEAGAGYLFRGLGNPTLGASAYQDWDVLIAAGRLAAPGGGTVPTALLERERSASLVATFARPRFRSYGWLSTGVNVRDRERVFDDPEQASGVDLIDPPPDVGAVATLGYSTVRSHPFSVSPEAGYVAAAQVEGRRFTRAAEGDDEVRGYFRATGRTQAYRGFRAWGFSRHVLALRLAGGGDAGSRSPGFTVGGLDGVYTAFPLATGVNLSDDLEIPVRGYPEGTQVGDRAAGATAEWRFPIALVERGIGLVPLYLDRVWGTAFADAGTAWCVETCDPALRPFTEARPLFSVGAELGADVLLGFNLRMRLRAGVAVPLRDAIDFEGNRGRPGVEGYFTFGQSF